MIIQTGMYVMQMITPVTAVKYTAGPKPISIFLNIIPFKYEKQNIHYILTMVKSQNINFTPT